MHINILARRFFTGLLCPKYKVDLVSPTFPALSDCYCQPEVGQLRSDHNHGSEYFTEILCLRAIKCGRYVLDVLLHQC